ncbi:unnamed protein product [Urochloa humidicola]
MELPVIASSTYVAFNMKTERIDPKPILLGGVPSDASLSYVAPNMKNEPIAPEPITLGEQSSRQWRTWREV